MNFLSLFVLIPVLMLGGLLLASDIKQIRAVCATGASLLLLLAVALTVLFLGERNSGNTAEMLFTASSVWYAPFHIHYSVGSTAFRSLCYYYLPLSYSPANSLRGRWNSCPGNTLCGFVC